jgi:hypothetical protein
MTTIKKNELKEQFVQFYESSACNISATCKRINISRNTFYEWRKEDAVWNNRLIEEEEALLDFAETMLFKGIKEGKTAELIFYLKTKGKKRGYVERTEIDFEQKQNNLDFSELSTNDLIDIITANEN